MHTLLNGRVKIMQPETGYRAGLDAVMLAAACPAQPGQAVLDLGCGVGAASLCLMARITNLSITGVEIQPEMADLARHNAARNNFTTFEVITGDIEDRTLPVPGNAFDQIIINPPYLQDNQAAPLESSRATAFVEMTPLSAWLSVARKKLKQGGALTIIHRADRFADIVQLLDGFGSIEVIPLWPKAGQAARRVIIRARKDRKTPSCLHPGIVLFNEDDTPTPAANNILRHAYAIL